MSKPAVRDIVREYLHAHRRRPGLDDGRATVRCCTRLPAEHGSGAAAAERAPLPRRMDGAPREAPDRATVRARSGFAARSPNTFTGGAPRGAPSILRRSTNGRHAVVPG